MTLSQYLIPAYKFTLLCLSSTCLLFFFFNDTATTEIYTLSLHDALPIYVTAAADFGALELRQATGIVIQSGGGIGLRQDRKSTRLNSSHVAISYAVFCLKKKKKSV